MNNIVDQALGSPLTERRRLLFAIAKSVLDEQPDSHPVMIAEGDEPPIGYLFRIPPMPESKLTPEEEAAEDAKRLASLDDSVSLDELLSMLDFGAAARSGRS